VTVVVAQFCVWTGVIGLLAQTSSAPTPSDPARHVDAPPTRSAAEAAGAGAPVAAPVSPVVGRSRDEAEAPAARPAGSSLVAQGGYRRAHAFPLGDSVGGRSPVSSSGALQRQAERAVLRLVDSPELGRMPPALIDPRTWRLRPRTEAVCRATARSDEFLCFVRPPSARTRTEGLYLRYRPMPRGRPAVIWLGYRLA